MNWIRDYLHRSHERLGLSRFDIPPLPPYLIKTPRFRASRHVIVIVLTSEGMPAVVLKVPRLAADCEAVQHEATILRELHGDHLPGSIPTGGEPTSVPRVVALDCHAGNHVLVETAIAGEPLRPAVVKRHRRHWCRSVLQWLTEVQRTAKTAGAVKADWYDRLVARPLEQLEAHPYFGRYEAELLSRTYALVAPLASMELAGVVEHGDLSHPNLLCQPNGTLGVVDWELANLDGMPGYDFFFFLAYAALAGCGSDAADVPIDAFEASFFAEGAWTGDWIAEYAHLQSLPQAALLPLFVATWMRQLATQLRRLRLIGDTGSADSWRWLRRNRHFLLWQHAVARAPHVGWK